MDIHKETIKKQVREWINLGYIVPEDIPSIELYMDQITTFMDKHLSKNKRTEEDKTLTKTMINNYTKNELLPPPDKKRYSKEHIILLIYIYYFKNVISISDIQTVMTPLIENFYDNDRAEYSLEDIYSNLYELEKRQFFNTANSITKTYELIERGFPGCEDDYLKEFTFLSLIGYDIFMKKKLMEHIIDEMSERNEEKAAKEKVKEAKAKSKTSDTKTRATYTSKSRNTSKATTKTAAGKSQSKPRTTTQQPRKK